MAEQKYVVVYAAAYPTVAAAQAVLETIEHLHSGEVAGTYDAAVIAEENGKPHVVKRMDHPYIRIIPEWFGSGTLAAHLGGSASIGAEQHDDQVLPARARSAERVIRLV